MPSKSCETSGTNAFHFEFAKCPTVSLMAGHSPYDKVLHFGIYMKQNLRFALVEQFRDHEFLVHF